ncbi:Ammonium transporter 3 member 1 [Glycine soja]|nr:Ammonium transporter 3 member 1 [Glycine soja]
MEFPTNLLPDEASPEWMNKGDNAWQLMAATVVGLQSIPGLVILYGSLVKKTWAINSAFMAFYAFAGVLLCWVGWGFRMSFGEKMVFFLGKPGVAVDEKFLLGKAFLGLFPNATMVFFQGVFAGITLILIAGALLGRMNFRAWMLFVPLWLTFSYTVTAFSIWCPDGWLAKLGVIDFSGGYVIHLSAGVAGVVQGWAAILMGVMSGSIPWYTMMILHDKLPFLKQIDDPMAVFHTHAVAGALGGVLTGLLAVPKLCRLFYMVPDWEKYIGLAYGLQNGATHAGLRQMAIQVGAIVFVIIFNFVTTSLICLLVGSIVPLRIDTDALQMGDKAMHGEEAFAFYGGDPTAKFENLKHNKVYDTQDFSFVRDTRSFAQLQMV